MLNGERVPYSSQTDIRKGKGYLVKPAVILLHCLLLFIGVMQYYHPFGFYPYPYAYLFILFTSSLFLLSRRVRFTTREYASIGSLIFIGTFFQFFNLEPNFSEIGTFWIAAVAAFVYVSAVIRTSQREFFLSVDVLIWLFSVALIIQILVHQAGGGYQDLHGMVIPWSEGKGTELSFGISRYTGIHQEPGTHATVTTGLLLLSILNSFKLRRVHVIATLGCALTGSAIGLIYFSFLVTVIFYKYLKPQINTVIYTLFFSFTSIYFIWTFFARQYINERFFTRSNDMSLNTRLDNYDVWLQWPFKDQVLGKGLAALRSFEFESLQGAGFLFSSIVCFGLVWPLVLAFSAGTLHGRRANLFALAVVGAFVAVSRLPPNFFMPFFLLFVAGSVRK
jgi:hypothetical protein